MDEEEMEFLRNYDPKKFKQLSMTTDILIISVSEEKNNNYRKNSKKKMSILLVKRETHPYKGKWCLPGGFLDPDTETLEQCAKRVLKDETNLSKIYIEQLYTFDGINRDPRCRVVSTSYMALVDKNRLSDKLNPNASWFNVTSYDNTKDYISIVLDNDDEIIKFKIKKTLRELSTDRYKFTIEENNKIAFDHPLVIASGIERLRNKLNYTDVVFNMMPTYFTLGELQQVYEVILGKKLLAPAFRRIIANKVEKTDKMMTGRGHRPSVLFKYVHNKEN
jgi:ADP-ribose pyrophosphatase YjhB (NUDIX family)